MKPNQPRVLTYATVCSGIECMSVAALAPPAHPRRGGHRMVNPQ